MVLNYIWIAFFLIAFVIALFRLVFLGDAEVFPAMMNSTFDTSKTAFEISLGLTGVLSLWLGVMKIGERGGVINVLARVLSPVFTRLFPDIPKGHPVTGSIFMNIAANMLGLDNAATPLGLKAMEQMNEVKDEKIEQLRNHFLSLTFSFAACGYANFSPQAASGSGAFAPASGKNVHFCDACTFLSLAETPFLSEPPDNVVHRFAPSNRLS